MSKPVAFISAKKAPPPSVSIDVDPVLGASIFEVAHPTQPAMLVQIQVLAHARGEAIVIEIQRALLVNRETREVSEAPYEGYIFFSQRRPA